jgi:hypothetical protein
MMQAMGDEPPGGDLTTDDLLALAQKWESLAAEAREQTRLTHASDLSRAAYNEGVVRTYLAAAADLRALIRPVESEASSAPPQYLAVTEADAADVLRRAGLFTRSLTLHPDRVFSAVFSRLQPLTLESRIRELTAADPRVVVLDSGTLRDSGDPYIDFAFAPDA